MPIITKTESYVYLSAHYPTEILAVEAAIRAVGANLVKEHAASMGVGLIAKREEIIELLTAYDRLSAPTPPEEATSESESHIPVHSLAIQRGDVSHKMSLADLDNGRHARNCNSRATGYLNDCSCGKRPLAMTGSQVFQEIVDAFNAATGETEAKAAAHVARNGYAFLSDFLEKANTKQVHQLQVILGLREEEE